MNAEQAYQKFRANPEQDTWLHLPFYREVARGIVFEIGVWEGASTSAFLCGLEKNGGHLYSVDRDFKCPAIKLLEGHPQWTFTLADSKNLSAMPQEIFKGIDVLYIDGDHSYEGVSADIKNYLPLVRPGGLMIMHDVGKSMYDFAPDFVGVQRAFQEVCDAHPTWRSYKVEGSWGRGVLEVQ